MPELPEVETIVRDLAPLLTNAKLRNPRFYKTDVLRGITAKKFLDAVSNARIVDLARRAKHIVMLLESGLRVIIQLRMTGNLIVYERRLRRAEEQYMVFRAGVGGGRTLVYKDVRRLGTFSLLNEGQWRTYTARIGPEPLGAEFDGKTLHQILQRTRQAVKKALMDQRLLAGVGNIYANEALFLAGIDPSIPANRLRPAQSERLCTTVRDVLHAAIEAKGTTLRDYRTGTGQPGSFQLTLYAYGRDGQPCRMCGTRMTTTHEIDGRATTFCWRCQGA